MRVDINCLLAYVLWNADDILEISDLLEWTPIFSKFYLCRISIPTLTTETIQLRSELP